MIDVFFFNAYTQKLKDAYAQTGSIILTEKFGGETSEKEIERVTEVAKPFMPEVIVGIGGGRTLDTAKAVADNFHVPIIIAPTTASTDALSTYFEARANDESDSPSYISGGYCRPKVAMAIAKLCYDLLLEDGLQNLLLKLVCAPKLLKISLRQIHF